MEIDKPKVCIIGAGPTGLVALRHLQDIADCKCFEMKDQIGGLWVYSDKDDSDTSESDQFYQQYGHAQESIYHDLTTIVPKYFLAYKDFPPQISGTHFAHREVLEYMQLYAENFNLRNIIFNTAMISVEKNHDRTNNHNWKVITQENDAMEEETHYFDYVVVCNGHNSVPYYPKEVSGLDSFQGSVLHVHNFRKPDTKDFLKKKILIVGCRWSGLDILYQFVDNKRLEGEVDFDQIFITVPEPDYLSGSDNFKPYFDTGKICVKKGKNIQFSESGVTFEDGTEEKIDTVLLCTGYQYKFPFIKDEGLITMSEDGRFFEPLYLRLFNINEPSIMFPGLADGNPLIQIVMEKQIIVIKSFIEGRTTLPYFEDMLKTLKQEKKQ